MELEENGIIPFLDFLLTRKEYGTLGHEVFRKKTHIESYLHTDSHHHPSQKIWVLNTLVVRSSRISDTEHLEKEKDHLKEVFTIIGYTPKDIKKTLDKAHNKSHANLKTSDNENTNPRACLPYIQGVTDKISIILDKNNITTSFKPLETVRKKMRSIKDPIDHTYFRGFYKVPWSCKIGYIGEMGIPFTLG